MTEPRTTDLPPARVRRFVAAILVLLAVPGIIGFEAWPLSGWRLFSLSRDPTQTRWEIDVVRPDEGPVTVDFDELPLGFRNAEWPLAELPGSSGARRDRVCLALLRGAREVVPSAEGLQIVRDRQRLAREEGRWVVSRDREVFHECGPGS